MIYTHEHYEMLAALATAGQLSASEIIDLEQHVRECVSCREARAEMEAMSRELFITHASSTRRSSLPVGMQQRFQERAIGAGIPLSRPVASPLNRGALRLALVTLILAICATLSWKVTIGPPVLERAADEADNSHQKMAHLRSDNERPIAKKHLFAISSQKRQPMKRKTTGQREPVIERIPESGTEITQTSFVLSQTTSLEHDYARTSSDNTSMVRVTLNQDYLTSGLHLAGRKASELRSMPNIWGAADRDRSDQRTFHYNPDLASLSFVDGSQGSGMTTIPTLNVSRSQFHLDINKTW